MSFAAENAGLNCIMNNHEETGAEKKTVTRNLTWV